MSNGTPWYARGETGERILSLIEMLLDGDIDKRTFVGKLRQIGLCPIEVNWLIEDAGV